MELNEEMNLNYLSNQSEFLEESNIFDKVNLCSTPIKLINSIKRNEFIQYEEEYVPKKQSFKKPHESIGSVFLKN
jgi:hypothetical protein